MNESRLSKIEEIRKKSLETSRDARIAEQGNEYLNTSLSLNERAGGSAAGAAGGAAGGGSGDNKTMPTVVSALQKTRRIEIPATLQTTNSLPYGGILNAYATSGPIASGGTEYNDSLEKTRNVQNLSEFPTKDDDLAFYVEDLATELCRAHRDNVFKSVNKLYVAKEQGYNLLDKNQTYDFGGWGPNGEQEEIPNLSFKEVVEKSYSLSANLYSPIEKDYPLDAIGDSSRYGLMGTRGIYDLESRGKYKVYEGSWNFHKPIVIDWDNVKDEVEILKTEATANGATPAEVAKITAANTNTYKSIIWPTPSNGFNKYGDSLWGINKFPVAGEGFEPSNPSKGSITGTHITWQPTYVDKDTEAVVRGHYTNIGAIISKSIDAPIIAKGGTINETFTIDLEDEYLTYKASRESSLKACGETMLAINPFETSAAWTTLPFVYCYQAELSNNENIRLPQPWYKIDEQYDTSKFDAIELFENRMVITDSSDDSTKFKNRSIESIDNKGLDITSAVYDAGKLTLTYLGTPKFKVGDEVLNTYLKIGGLIPGDSLPIAPGFFDTAVWKSSGEAIVKAVSTYGREATIKLTVGGDLSEFDAVGEAPGYGFYEGDEITVSASELFEGNIVLKVQSGGVLTYAQ